MLKKLSSAHPSPKIFLEISGAVLAVLIAGLLGNYVALIATQNIDDNLIRFAASIFVGLLVGITIGVVAHKIWSHFLKPVKQQSD